MPEEKAAIVRLLESKHLDLTSPHGSDDIFTVYLTGPVSNNYRAQ